ncbi:MAG: hypothetical protein GY811_31040 [Myxococcales bacterium]|nr:hypothetical protein [Myxococcales bacterium]
MKTEDSNAEDPAEESVAPRPPFIRELFVNGDTACVRYIDDQLKCARLQYADKGFDIESRPLYVRGSGPVVDDCIADGADVTCRAFDKPLNSGRARAETYMFPSSPIQLAFLPRLLIPIPGKPGYTRLGPRRLCALSAEGEVVCKELGGREAKARTWTLFTSSSAIRGNGGDLLSLRADGGLECVGKEACASLALAHALAHAGDGFDELEASWPNSLVKRIPVERPLRVDIAGVEQILSVNPTCVAKRDGAIWCWQYHSAPQRSEAMTKSQVPWNGGQCSLAGDNVSCADSQSEETLHSHTVEGAERLARWNGRLCVFTRQKTVTCYSDEGSMWGEHEVVLDLASGL